MHLEVMMSSFQGSFSGQAQVVTIDSINFLHSSLEVEVFRCGGFKIYDPIILQMMPAI